MSATTENILEELRKSEHKLEQARIVGNQQEAAELLEQITNLRQQLMLASAALNESRQVLKG